MNEYLELMREQVGYAGSAPPAHEESVTRYATLLALASIAESLATLAANAANEAQARKDKEEYQGYLAEMQIRKAARDW
jgi:hypothetical protein